MLEPDKDLPGKNKQCRQCMYMSKLRRGVGMGRNGYFTLKGVIAPRPSQCEICGRASNLARDHCHKTSVFRGWLCSRCNINLEWFLKYAESIATYNARAIELVRQNQR